MVPVQTLFLSLFFPSLLSAQQVAPSINFLDRSELLANPTLASGVAIGVVDMNQDGRDDIVHFDGARELLIDYQSEEGTFTQTSLGQPSESIQWGLAIGDTDNNGFPDIISGGFFDGLHYQRANADGSEFSQETLTNPSIYLQAVNFVDIDNDGWLDLFPCHDLGNNPPFGNDGAGNLSHTPSLINTRTTAPSDNSGNYGSLWTDYDSDGDLDLYISKCRARVTDPTDPRRVNQLFQNDGDGNFTEVAAAAGLADGRQSWTSDFADIDNDGDLDCFIGNHMAPSRLLINQGDGTFIEESEARGLLVDWDVIQSVFRDFDNDGWTDLLLTGSEHGLWLNDRDGTFTKAGNPFSTDFIESAAVGDLNRDGFTDLYAGYARLYNIPRPDRPDRLFLGAPNGNRYLSVTLDGTTSNRLASGARLELHGPWGVQIREVRSGEGYAVTHSFTQTFGMGTSDLADKLVVRWPSGQIDTLLDVPANQFLTLREGFTGTLTLTNPGTQSSLSGVPVTLQTATNDSSAAGLTFLATNLPTGLTIDTNTGAISGTPMLVAGTFQTTLSVSDGQSMASQSFLWTIRPPSPGNELAFASTLPLTTGRIQAEDYDTAGAGLSYYDRDSSNLGESYREDGVDLIASTDSDETAAVSWIEDGEWLSYSVTLLPGDYDITARVASPLRVPGIIRLWIGDREVGSIAVPQTASWQSWQNVVLPAIPISESGSQAIRLEFIGSSFALNWLEILPSTREANGDDSQRPFLGAALPLPGRVEAEYYDLGGEGIAYQDNEASNLTETFRSEGVDLEPSSDTDESVSLSFFDDGEWLEYTLSVRPGLYEISLRTAAGVANPGSLALSLDGTQIARVQTPDTGSYQFWETTTLTGIPISTAGRQVLRLTAVGDGINLNWIDFVRVGPLPNAPPDEPIASEELLADAFGPSPSPGVPTTAVRAAEGESFAFLARLDSRASTGGLANGDFQYLPQASSDLLRWDLPIEQVPVPEGLPTPPQGYKYNSYRLVDRSASRAFFRVEVTPQ